MERRDDVGWRPQSITTYVCTLCGTSRRVVATDVTSDDHPKYCVDCLIDELREKQLRGIPDDREFRISADWLWYYIDE